MFDHIFFYLGLTFLIIHEMDAVYCKEWRIIPGLSSLKEKTGYIVFLSIHVPVLTGIFILLNMPGYMQTFILIFDILLILHLILHILFMKHEKNEFKKPVSWTIISGGAIFGLADIILNYLIPLI